MNISTIEQGEELLKASTPGPWFYDGIGYLFQGTPHDAQMVADDGDGKQTRMRGTGADLPLDKNAELIAFLINHASELLQMAREVERVKEHILRYMSDNRRDIQCMCAVKSPSCGCVNDDYNKALDDVEKFIKEDLA
jgi:hypothetical protein